jgi:hypothetical protein
MTLDDFQRIWYMEWGHRIWGRAVGLVFIVPAVILWRKGYIQKRYKPVSLRSSLGAQTSPSRVAPQSVVSEIEPPNNMLTACPLFSSAGGVGSWRSCWLSGRPRLAHGEERT